MNRIISDQFIDMTITDNTKGICRMIQCGLLRNAQFAIWDVASFFHICCQSRLQSRSVQGSGELVKTAVDSSGSRIDSISWNLRFQTWSATSPLLRRLTRTHCPVAMRLPLLLLLALAWSPLRTTFLPGSFFEISLVVLMIVSTLKAMELKKKTSGRIPFRFRYLKPFGVRNLYQWGRICFPKGSKHAGLPFSQVLTQDPQYCRWIEGRPARVSSAWMKNFQNYMQAVENAKMQATSVQQDAAEGARSLILDKIPLDGRRVGQKP